LDVTSIKKGPAEALEKYAPKWVLVIPTHPMFW
jgi:prephenate dehydrogenase